METNGDLLITFAAIFTTYRLSASIHIVVRIQPKIVRDVNICYVAISIYDWSARVRPSWHGYQK